MIEQSYMKGPSACSSHIDREGAVLTLSSSLYSALITKEINRFIVSSGKYPNVQNKEFRFHWYKSLEGTSATK